MLSEFHHSHQSFILIILFVIIVHYILIIVINGRKLQYAMAYAKGRVVTPCNRINKFAMGLKV